MRSPTSKAAASPDSQSLVNAASVSATNASVASLGLIAAGFVLYRQDLPAGAGAGLLIGGVVVSLAGTALLLGSRPVPAER